MPKIFPFRGTHFDPGKVGDVSNVVTQPYDKIDDALQTAYYQKHENNFVRIIRRKEEDRYEGAAKTIDEWLKSGALVEDPEPGFYAYYQTYNTPGGQKTRKGFVAMVRAEPFDRGLVRPHEETHSGPKIDRYKLLTATRSHFGQVFLLYSDPEKKVNQLLDEAARNKPDLQAKDELGVIHRVWRIADAEKIRAIEKDLERREAIIADGHHRFETAVQFGQDMKARGLKPEAPGESFENVMCTLVNMDDEGLTLYPTHRVVYDAPGWNPERLRTEAAKYFDINEYPFSGPQEEESARAEMMEDLSIEGYTQAVFGVAVSGARSYCVYKLRDKKAAAALVREQKSEEWRSLDVNILHTVLLERILGIGKDRLDREENVKFVRWIDEALEMIHGPNYQVAFLVNPVRVEEIKTLVKKGERFPQKTTDFYPKMITGLVFCRLRF